LAVLTLALIYLCFKLAVPLLPALTWAFALAIIAWPLHARIARHVPGRMLPAVLSTTAVVALILVPGLFVSYELVREATSAAEQVKERSAEGVLRQSLENTPGLRTLVEWSDRVGVDVDQGVRQLVTRYTQDASDLIQGSVEAVLQAVIGLFVLYHLFRDRAALMHSVRMMLPLTRDETDQVFKRAADSVYANLYATVVTSIIDGVGGGLMFWATGLPSPVVWGVVIFILSVLPILGTGLVWVPAGVYLALIGRWPEAVALFAWGLAGWVVVDNYLYVKLAGPRMRLHEVPAMIAFLGGLVVFGASGMIIGPAILAVTVAVLEVWHHRMVVTPSAGSAPAGPGLRAAAGPAPDEPSRVQV
jgi:predicted PurR-regulated permease PerM